jgi:hypothetical protein
MNSSTYVVGGWVKNVLSPLLPFLARMWLSRDTCWVCPKFWLIQTALPQCPLGGRRTILIFRRQNKSKIK